MSPETSPAWRFPRYRARTALAHSLHRSKIFPRSRAMSAKKSKPAPASAAQKPLPTLLAATPVAATTAEEFVPWSESPDPKKRQIAKVVLIGVWLYVAALGLLALDQWFHLGIFGPKPLPLP